jgi:hypothetical protein
VIALLSMAVTSVDVMSLSSLLRFELDTDHLQRAFGRQCPEHRVEAEGERGFGGGRLAVERDHFTDGSAIRGYADRLEPAKWCAGFQGGAVVFSTLTVTPAALPVACATSRSANTVSLPVA